MQIVVTKELNKNIHIWVTSLTRTLDRARAKKLLEICSGLEEDDDRQNADSVVNVSSEANIELFKNMIQEGDQMCEELKELLAPEIIEFKIRLAEQNEKLADNAAQLADKDEKLANKDAEIAMLKKKLADFGIEV
jgi:tryptophanyl-tRNA synthetase